MEKPYSLGCPAADKYKRLSGTREAVLERARDNAELTIPSVFPPQGYTEGEVLPSNNQSIGSLCVNTLASKLMYMAMPPDRPNLKYNPVEHLLAPLVQGSNIPWGAVEEAVSNLEQAHMDRLEATTSRTAYTTALKQLLIGGNCLWEHMDIDTPCVHRMDRYVVWRNKKGAPLGVILEDPTAPVDLDPETLAFVHQVDAAKKGINPGQPSKDDEHDECIMIYRVERKVNVEGTAKWEYWEEYEGEVIPGTQVTNDDRESIFYPAWLIPMYGHNWGGSYCGEYLGDLYQVETHSSAVNDGAAAASLTLLFNKAGSPTTERQIKRARNLDVLTGSADQLSAFRLDKTGDYQFVLSVLEQAARRLNRAFLLVSSVQRQGERVTAEEFRTMAQELEEATGGMYSELAQSFQQHVMRRFVRMHREEDPKLPTLPDKYYKFSVVTGIEALGRSIQGQAIVRSLGAAAQVVGAQEVAKNVNSRDVIRRLMVAEAVRQPSALLKTEDQVAQEQAQMKNDAMSQEMVSKTAGPLATAVGSGRLALPSPTQDAGPPQQS